MGARSRKRRRTDGAPREPRVRGEALNEQLRANIVPLAPGERPPAVTLAAGLALFFGLGNLVLFAAGYSVRGQDDPSAGGAIAFAVIMVAAAVGMWQVRYWAVLGFQCLLAVTGLSAGLALLVASNVQALVLCVFILVASGTLFWYLVRAMSRIQMPQRPERT